MWIKPSEALRFLGGLAAAALVLGFIALRVTHDRPQTPAPEASAPSRMPAVYGKLAPTPTPAPAPLQTFTACDAGPQPPAQANAASLQTLAWAPFGRPETGWETYAPLIAREIATPCEPQTPGFASALKAWQAKQGLPADGIMSDAVFNPLKTVIQVRRPFVQVSARKICPDPPPEATLATAAAGEGYGGKAILLRPAALDAWRRLAEAARREDPRIAADPRNLQIFSGYRSPVADAARCAKDGNCNNLVRATCSAHRTGLAMDLYVGQAPGYGPDSSADANRLAMSRSPTYRWLVANADRFGFVPYPFEPWHWEWTGEAP